MQKGWAPVATLAPLVLTAATDGDEVAKGIVQGEDTTRLTSSTMRHHCPSYLSAFLPLPPYLMPCSLHGPPAASYSSLSFSQHPG